MKVKLLIIFGFLSTIISAQKSTLKINTNLNTLIESADSIWDAKSKKNSYTPIIGISTDIYEGKTMVRNTYIKAIINAGGLPYILPVSNDPSLIGDIINNLDGIVLTGGQDVHPILYNENPHPKLEAVSPERDINDLLWIHFALKKDLPILAICRGEQYINVVYGGSLYQDLPTQFPNDIIQHRQNMPGNTGSHYIQIADNTHLKSILQVDSILVNSFHHQAIKKVGNGLTISAIASDGVVEAVENSNGNVIAVQFHPEIFAAEGKQPYLNIFTYLIEKAKNKDDLN